MKEDLPEVEEEERFWSWVECLLVVVGTASECRRKEMKDVLPLFLAPMTRTLQEHHVSLSIVLTCTR